MWRIGQRIVCIAGQWTPANEEAVNSAGAIPIKDEIYTIRRIYYDSDYNSGVGFGLCEISRDYGFDSIAFRPLLEGFADSVVEKIEKEIKQEELTQRAKMATKENQCNGEWKNDCPHPFCECAKKIQRELDEDYSEERDNTAWGFLGWIVLLALLIGSFIYGVIKLWHTAQ